MHVYVVVLFNLIVVLVNKTGFCQQCFVMLDDSFKIKTMPTYRLIKKYQLFFWRLFITNISLASSI